MSSLDVSDALTNIGDLVVEIEEMSTFMPASMQNVKMPTFMQNRKAHNSFSRFRNYNNNPKCCLTWTA